MAGVAVVAQAQQMCGGSTYPFPYTDVSGVAAPFCPGIMEAYVTAISRGTTPTTFSPNNDVIRLQMTTFLQRTVDQVLTRGSRRAELSQRWTAQGASAMQTISVGGSPQFCAADGQDIWTTTYGGVVQVQANTGHVLGKWTGATNSFGILAAAGKVYIAGNTSPGTLYAIDPTQPPGALSSVAPLGVFPNGIAFDGTSLWTANYGGSVSIISPTGSPPYPVMTVTTGFTNPNGILYDGAHIWVTDGGSDDLFKLDALGNIIQAIPVGTLPSFPVFDGTNIWVPNFSNNTITVVQASTGFIVATIDTNASNHLSAPIAASFDGERILVTNYSGNSVSVFKAADLSFVANVATASGNPYGACSDGINFWITPPGTGKLVRF